MFSCGENGDGNDDVTPNSSSSVGRVYILNEGVWGGNDAELSRYSPEEKTITNDYFSNKNGRGLGDVGNDIEVYGSKVYVVMNTSNTLEVIDKNTGMSVKRMTFSLFYGRIISRTHKTAYMGKEWSDCRCSKDSSNENPMKILSRFAVRWLRR